MRKSLLVVSSVFVGGNNHAADFIDTAQVLSSTPIYESISEPRRECTKESVQVAPKERSVSGAVVGGVAGGLLGSQVGRGNRMELFGGVAGVFGGVKADSDHNVPARD